MSFGIRLKDRSPIIVKTVYLLKKRHGQLESISANGKFEVVTNFPEPN